MTALAATPPGAWPRQGLTLALASAAILALHIRDAADIARIWATSDTFGHCALVPPLALWLAWRRRDALAELTPRTWWPGLAVVALGGLGWAFGTMTGIAQASHLALLLMLQGSAIALLGPAVSRALAFPIAWLVFAIPFGIELVPPLQAVTADIAMALLAVSGIPATLDGLFIATPAGLFRVAEACAGVNFLIAMLAFATLAAHLLFRSPARQAGFVAFAAVTSILANGVRAWGTIAIAQSQGTAFAAGFDHIVYGWLFFALILALVIAAGRAFAEPEAYRPPASEGDPPPSDDRVVAALAALLLLPLAALAAGG